MADNYVKTAFTVPVTADEAALLTESFAVAEEIDSAFASFPDMSEMAAAKYYYAGRSEAFRQAFPPRDDEEDPFATFFLLFNDAAFPAFDAEISIHDGGDGIGKYAFIRGDQADVWAIAELLQKVCRSALPFGFEWATCCSALRPNEFGGGFFVIAETAILGGSTGWHMRQALQSLNAGA